MTIAPWCSATLTWWGNPNERACEPAWSWHLRWMGSIFLWMEFCVEVSCVVRYTPLWDFTFRSLEGTSVFCRYINYLYFLHHVSELALEDITGWSNTECVQKLKTSEDTAVVISSHIHISLCISGANLICSCSTNSFSPNLLLKWVLIIKCFIRN